MKILIAHAESELDVAELIAEPLRSAGYEVAHRGTVIVGESIVQEASKLLLAGGPVVLCGTVRAVGTGWANRLVNAARLHPNVRIYAVQIEKEAFLDALSLDGTIATYWQDSEKAITQLIEALRKYYPPSHKDEVSETPVTIDALKAATTEFTRARLRLIGRGRYFPDLYVQREVTAQLSDFLYFEHTVRERSSSILGRLRQIADERPGYGSAKVSIACAYEAFEGLDPTAAEGAIRELKLAFNFSLVDKITSEVTQAVQVTILSEFESLLRSIVDSLRLLPGMHEEVEYEGVRESIATAARVNFSSAGLTEPSMRISAVWHFLPAEPARDGTQAATANALIEELDKIRRLLDVRCTTLVGPAGCGKTSLLCAITEQLLQSHPTILIAGRHAASHEHVIFDEILSAAARAFRTQASLDCNQLSEVARAAGDWIYILIDGINENSNPEAFSRAIDRFMTSTLGSRFRLVLSCRDVSWPVCNSHIAPHLSESGQLQLTVFSDKEWTGALSGYQDKYRTRLSLSSDAEAVLRHPLLLRLFFESHRNDLLGHVVDLRRLGLFDKYLQTALERVANRRGLLRPETARKLLMDVGAQMLANCRDYVRLNEIQLNPQELEDPDSNYNALRSEGLIEDVEDVDLGRCLRFTYSELGEYVIALIWHARIADSPLSRRAQMIDDIINSSVESLSRFELLSGALILLDELVDKSGRLLNDCICRVMTDDFGARSTALLAIAQMFDHLRPEAATNQTFEALERLESEGGPEVKEALIPAALRLLDAHSANPLARVVGTRILGVDEGVVPTFSDIENRYRFHLDAYEVNERMTGDKDFQRDYYLKAEVREHSRFALRFRNEEFTKGLLHDPAFAASVFGGGSELHPVGWQELLVVYRDSPEFARRFDGDPEFREACLQAPEFVYAFSRAFNPEASQDAADWFRRSPLYRKNPELAARFDNDPSFRERCLNDPNFLDMIRRYRELHGDEELYDEDLRYRAEYDPSFREAYLRDPDFIRSYDRRRRSRRTYLDYLTKYKPVKSRLKDRNFIRVYLETFEVREASGRLLEMQSAALRKHLLTNVEFRELYLHNPHFRELWFRNPECAWEHRGQAIGLKCPPESNAFVRHARYKYEDSARLNALSILARNEDQKVIDLLVGGIRELKVKHAIAAFRGIDQSSDKVAIEIARRFVRLDSPDYIIFSAWLLRRRHGKIPAELLAAMLCYPVTRVHRYAMRLFDSREVEEELFSECVRKLEEVNLGTSKTIQSWHIINLCTIIAMALERGVGRSEMRTAVRRVLSRLRKHPSPAVSESANRALSNLTSRQAAQGKPAGTPSDENPEPESTD